MNSGGIITTLAGNGTLGYAGDGGPASASELAGPDGVALDSAGNLLIADTSNNRVRQAATSVCVNVTPAPLTIAANSQTKLYSEALPTLTVSYSGFVNGDTSASLTASQA